MTEIQEKHDKTTEHYESLEHHAQVANNDSAGYQSVPAVLSEEEYKTTFKTWLVIVALGICWGTCTLANVGPGSTSSHVGAALTGSTSSSWIANSTLFPLIGLQPLWGTLGDRFGKKWFMVAGGLVGVIGNIVAGRATSINQVIAGQVVNGIGASLLLLVIPTAMEVVPAKTRPWAQGVSAVINGIMAIVGLIESGGVAQMSANGWRWVYYFNAIFFGLAVLLVGILYNPPPTKLRRENSIMEVLKSVDIVGITLLLCGVIGVVMGLTWGGNEHPWSSPQVIGTLTVGCSFLIGFGCFETWGRNDGLIDHRFLQSRNFLIILSVAFVDGMLLYGVNAFFPIEAEAIFTTSTLQVNLYLLPLNVMVLLGCLGSAAFLGYLKHYRLLLVLSLLITSAFLGLLVLVTPSRVAMTCVFTGIIGLGVGVTTVIPVVILTYSIPPHLLGTGGTTLASTRALGGAIGISIFASIYSNAMAKNLPTGLAHAVVSAGLPSSSVASFLQAFLNGVGDLEDIKGVTPSVLSAATNALAAISAHSFRFVWIANMAVAIFSAVLCVFLKPVKDSMTMHVESALESGGLRTRQMNLSTTKDVEY